MTRRKKERPRPAIHEMAKPLVVNARGRRKVAALRADPDFEVKWPSDVETALHDLQRGLMDFGACAISIDRVVCVRERLAEAASAIGQALVTVQLLERDLREMKAGRERAWGAFMRLHGSEGLIRRGGAS